MIVLLIMVTVISNKKKINNNKAKDRERVKGHNQKLIVYNHRKKTLVITLY